MAPVPADRAASAAAAALSDRGDVELELSQALIILNFKLLVNPPPAAPGRPRNV